MHERRRSDPRRTRMWMFWLAIGYLVVLFWLALAYNTRSLIEPLRSIPDPVGSMPLAVPWFGALGGTLISLGGVNQHRYDWDERYWTWYVVRPFIGASVAIVAVMIVQAGILATGVDTTTGDAGTRNTTYYLVAWIVGYRESTFRSLVKRLADVVFTSSDEGLPPRISEVAPSSGDPDGGTAATIKGTGFTGAEAVTFGAAEATSIRVLSDTVIEVVTPAGTGVVSVGVTTANGSSALAKAFAYQAPEPPTSPPEPPTSPPEPSVATPEPPEPSSDRAVAPAGGGDGDAGGDAGAAGATQAAPDTTEGPSTQ